MSGGVQKYFDWMKCITNQNMHVLTRLQKDKFLLKLKHFIVRLNTDKRGVQRCMKT